MKIDGSDFIVPVCIEQQQVFEYIELKIYRIKNNLSILYILKRPFLKDY